MSTSLADVEAVMNSTLTALDQEYTDTASDVSGTVSNHTGYLTLLEQSRTDLTKLHTTWRDFVYDGSWSFSKWGASAAHLHDDLAWLRNDSSDWGLKAIIAKTFWQTATDVKTGVKSAADSAVATAPYVAGFILIILVLVLVIKLV